MNTISRKELSRQFAEEYKARRRRINKDFNVGFKFIRNVSNTVTVFGSARFTEQHPDYQKAREIGALLANEGYTVVTGGAGGIMEAANRGAYENGGQSIGLNIQLPKEQNTNPYLTSTVAFHYFFPRKVFLAFATNALIVCPGGFGTLDELFEILTLIQTHKIPKVPVILVGTEFWTPMQKYIQEMFVEKYKTINQEDINLFTITDNLEEIKNILQKKEINDVETAFSN